MTCFHQFLGFSMFFPRDPSAFVQGARVRRAVLEALERPEDGWEKRSCAASRMGPTDRKNGEFSRDLAAKISCWMRLVVMNFGNQPWLWSACVFLLSGWFGLHSEWDIHYDWGIEKGNAVILFWLFLKKLFMWAVAETMFVDDYMNYTTLSILLMIRIHELEMPITSFKLL